MNKYFYKYVNGNKWIQINGEGDDPKNCKISWESSKDNEDMNIVEMNERGISPLYGRVEFNKTEILQNIYIQVLKISPLIRDGYICKKYDVPHINSPLPDPQIIMTEKEDKIETEKISISKSELLKAVNVIVPRSYDKEDRKFEDKLAIDMDKWIMDRERDLRSDLKSFYDELNY